MHPVDKYKTFATLISNNQERPPASRLFAYHTERIGCQEPVHGRSFRTDFNLLSIRICQHKSASGPHKSAYMQYEILFLVGQNEESRLKEIESETEKIITEIGGKFSEDRWQDERKLAYPIKHQVRGTYIARRFELPEQDVWAESSDAAVDRIAEATKKLNLFHSVLRFTIVRADKLETLGVFAARKDEEQQSHRRQAKIAPKKQDARRSSLARKPIEKKPAPVQKEEKPQRTSTTEEINEKLDEILGE